MAKPEADTPKNSPELSTEIVSEAVNFVQHHHIYTEPGGSREAFAIADRVSPYGLRDALFEVITSTESELPDNFGELCQQLEFVLAENKQVQSFLRRNRVLANYINRRNTSKTVDQQG